uniref:Putative secreted protein n=1 Tax=Anopheles marajoara TaxID=58244 RepID=A0A2M4C8D4_9DIPT
MRMRRMITTMLPRAAAISVVVARISPSVTSERSLRPTMNGCHLTTIVTRQGNPTRTPMHEATTPLCCHGRHGLDRAPLRHRFVVIVSLVRRDRERLKQLYIKN